MIKDSPQSQALWTWNVCSVGLGDSTVEAVLFVGLQPEHWHWHWHGSLMPGRLLLLPIARTGHRLCTPNSNDLLGADTIY